MTRDNPKKRTPAVALRTKARKNKREVQSGDPAQRAAPGSAATAGRAAVAMEVPLQTAKSLGEKHQQNGVSEISTTAVIGFDEFSLHDLFEQQARHLLDRADIDEEQKQSIMLAMSCPCCGAGGPSFTVKLTRS